MGFGSLWHWIIVLLVVLVLFGRGRISEIMGDFGKGIKSFKQGLGDDEPGRQAPPPPPAQISADASAPSAPANSSETTKTGGS